MSVNDIIAPIVSELFENGNREQISNIYWRSTKWVSLISVPTAVVLGIFSETVIEIIYGSDFTAGAGVLSIFVLFELGKTVFGPSAFTLQMTGDQNWNLYTNVVSSLANVLLNIVFIPVLGILGAAVASGVSLFLNNLIHFLVLLTRKDIGLLSGFNNYNVWKVVLINIPFLITTLFCYEAFDNILYYVVTIALSGLIYLTLAYIVVLDDFEKSIIRNALR
jgi:O-antigen/teichoic acid export membrane protein